MVMLLIAAGLLGWVISPAEAAVHVEGQVQAGGGAVAGSAVSLWAASADSPVQLTEVQTDADGNFVVSADQAPDGASLYLVATGGTPSVNKPAGNNSSIALLAMLGAKPPVRAVVNEFTTVASVWTHAQFLNGTAIQGHALGLRIAAGNVPNFVDFATGGWGASIQDPLNSGQTPTMANFATLADLLAGCADASDAGRVRGVVPGRDATQRRCTDQHIVGRTVDCPLSLVSAGTALCLA
jgi:hypothetical protein